jgi:hypothetical protein
MTVVSDVLSNPREQPACLLDLLQRFSAAGLNANGWQAQQFARIASEVTADTISSYEVNRKLIFDGGYISTATGVYLDLAATWYGEKRRAATTTIVQLRASDSVGAGPYSLKPGQIATFDPTGVAGGPLFYRSTQQIDVPKNGFVDVLFAAEAAGAKYNVAPGSVTSLKTPVPGVAITSPAITGQGSILVVAGTDRESDDLLRLRCLLLLSTLGTGWAKKTIESLILDNFPAVTRLVVRDPGGVPGVPDAWLAGPSAPVSAQTALDVYNFLRAEIRKPVGNYPVRAYQASLLTKTLSIQTYTDGSNPNVLTAEAARLLSFQSSLALGTKVFSSRVVDELVDVPTGALAVSVIDVGTGQQLVDFQPRFSDAVVFAPTFLPAILV